jgi:hypothetical protein
VRRSATARRFIATVAGVDSDVRGSDDPDREVGMRFPAFSSALIACVMSFAGCSGDFASTGPSPRPDPGVATPTPPPTPTPAVPEIPFTTLNGSYHMTLAAADCQDTFPNAYRTRTYAAQVDQEGTDVTFVLPGVPPVAGTTESPRLWGLMGSDHLMLTTYFGNDQWFPIFGQVDPTHLVNVLIDEMIVTGSADRLSGVWTGQFRLREGTARGDPPVILARCESNNHGVTFAR